MKRWIRTWILLLFISVFIMGCSNAPEPLEKNQLLIGVSFDSFVVERWQRELEILVAKISELGAEVDVQIANEDLRKQIEQIKYLIDQNVDVLIVVPNDSKGLSEVLGEANRKGIKIIAYDRLILNPDVDLYISFDNESIGESMATRLISALKEQERSSPYEVLIVNGDPKDNNAILLRKGFLKVLNPLIEVGEVVILEEVWAEEWREQFASNLVEKYLEEGNEPDGVIAANDVLALGAFEVLSKWQKAESVFIVSQDAELSACQRIVEGTQLATVYKPLNALANTSANAAVGMAKGETIETKDYIFNDYKKVPYIRLDAFIVDAQNIDSLIIDSGFHLRKDVYLNIED